MMKKILFKKFLPLSLGGIMLLLSMQKSYATDVNILDYGADTQIGNNAPYIQKAIDDCAAKGGGNVHVPSGTFVSGTIMLKSNVNLYLHAQATIQGSIDHPADYPKQALVTGEDIENASIVGEGVLDGQGDHKNFQYGDNKGNRPFLVLFLRCRNMTVKDITLRNSAFWTFRLAFSDGVMIRGIHIYSHGNHNCDGIDIDSKNVLISDCRIDCDDDAICFKSDRADFVVEHVVVTNCIISSNCNAIKFGTAGHGGFRNIAISNCVIHKASENNIRSWKKMIPGVATDTTVISGIALEVVDGGFMDQVVISNISMRDIQTPVFIRLGSRKTVGSLQNVLISGITAYSESWMASTISGIPGHYVDNVTLRDIILYYPGGANQEGIDKPVPENEKGYPENRMFGAKLPAYGLYVRHVRNLTIENFQCYTVQPDERPALVVDDVSNLSLNNFQASYPSGNLPLIRLIQTSDVSISGFRPSQTTLPLFLQATGDQCRNIHLVRNNFTRVKKVADSDPSIKKNLLIQDNIQ
jgi:polygalacturonase